jgi:peptidoglycan/LPS O-acetylase OafA/YrhL
MDVRRDGNGVSQASAAHAITYRPDIDGLRAVAVGIVVLFHAWPKWLRSGFIGVDVFFVISGFLITSIILQDLRQRAFTIRGFYVRRIRRIFPALITVVLAVLAFG